jgi:uncharacterized protein (DUF2225 family)
MKKIRKINKAARKKARKEAQEKLAKSVSLMASHPTECCVCATPFKRTHQTVKSWQVVIREERVRLTCPSCWATTTEALENRNND